MSDATRALGGQERPADVGLVKGLGLFDATMIVVGSMIGSGIFIVSADRKSTRLNSSHIQKSRMPSSA